MPKIISPLDKSHYEVDRFTECWNWKLKSVSHNGYAQVSQEGKTKRASHVFFEKEGIKILKNQILRHKCSNRLCVNPRHLEISDIKEVTRKGKGTKLKKSDIIWIRKNYFGKTQKYLAKKFGINQPQISRIINYKRWLW